MHHKKNTCFSLCLKYILSAFQCILYFTPIFSQYNFKIYTAEDGLPQSQVSVLYQDSRGNLWTGTYGGGASKYDGKSFTHFTTKNGLKSNVVRAILEDSKGNLWFGTESGGACKYDGYDFTCFTEENGMSDNDVYAIAEDRNGNIWFGTVGGGITVYTGNNLIQVDTALGLISNNIQSILYDSNGNLWFGTEGGASFLSSDEIEKITSEGVRWVSSESPSDQSNDTTVLHTIDWRHFVAQNVILDSIHAENTIAALSHDVVYSIIEDRNSNILFGTMGGGISILKMRGISGLKDELSSDAWQYINIENGLCDNDITALYEDKTGNIWAGTYGSGICKIIGGLRVAMLKFDHLDENDGLSNSIIRAIIEDRSGNLWIGTDGGGLIKYLGETFTHYTTNRGLASNIILSVIKDQQGNLWFGALEGGGLSKLSQNGNFTNFSTRDVLESDMVIALAEDQAGRIWAGTNNGVCIYESEKLAHFNAIDELNESVILTIDEDKKGNLWFGTDGGGIVYFHPDSIDFSNQNSMANALATQTVTVADGLLGNTIWVTLEDRQGNIWIGTQGGGVSKLIPLDNDSIPYQIENITEENGLSNNFILNILEDPFGNIWFGTYGGGISVLIDENAITYSASSTTNISQLRKTQSQFSSRDQQEDSTYQWIYLNSSNNLSDDGIVSMAFDAVGNMWVGTNKGVNKISNIERGLQNPDLFRIQQYGKLEGFAGIECNQKAICQDNKGNIWFGTAHFVTKYNPWADKLNTIEPQTRIIDARLFFEKTDWKQFADTINPWTLLPANLEIPYNKNHLTFDFIGVSLKIPEKVRYQYMLEGLDDDWSPPVKETFATYPGIPPGNYTFKVKACNNDGIWNENPATFSFTITPPFWRTWWFYTLCAIAVMLGIYSFVMIRIRNLQRAKRILEEQVKLRTKQLRKEKVLVEKQKTELEVAYNKLKELENFKRSMIGMIVHDLKNPLNSILSFSQYDPAKNILQNIYRAGRQMLNLVMNILDVQKFEDTEVKLNIEEHAVAAIAGNAVQQVTHLAEQKSISIVQEINPKTSANLDEETIVRVVVNLLTNAIKYTPSSGKITVSTELSNEEKETVRIAITDTGVGIPEDKLDTVFDQFTQITAKDSGQVASTGIGLTFCKMAVEAHGGKIGVNSKVGEGTTFYFTLPKGEEIPEKETETDVPAKKTEAINSQEAESTLIFSDEDKKALEPIIGQFNSITVYHTTENMEILSQINANNMSTANHWIEEMQTAVYNCNENKYIELLEILNKATNQ